MAVTTGCGCTTVIAVVVVHGRIVMVVEGIQVVGTVVGRVNQVLGNDVAGDAVAAVLLATVEKVTVARPSPPLPAVPVLVPEPSTTTVLPHWVERADATRVALRKASRRDRMRGV
jgi:hypothetical protein